MTTQTDVYNAQIAQFKAQQATNTANTTVQNTQLDLQISNTQAQIAALQSNQGE